MFATARKYLTHPYLALLLRLYIGGLFIYASMYKINYAAEFAETIASYQIVPYWLVNPMAVFLPWTELVGGLLLFSGFRARSAAVLIGFLLLLFSVAVLVNLLRDAPISCGCFQTLGEKMTWKTLARDIIWLAMVIHVYCFDRLFHLEERFSLTLKEIQT
ncbi:MAG: DoxX family membrane protein [Syntrophobacteraceae bacterium]|jgi:uncharacterized membrane protein YphA (DoxX/SURF4 family)|nr:DoxX family membrane protein [Syntrophobacteraceae bacterium]